MSVRTAPSADAGTLRNPAELAAQESEIFSSAVAQALASPEIIRELAFSRISKKDLHNHLRETKDYLIARAAAEQSHWSTAYIRSTNPRAVIKGGNTRDSPAIVPAEVAKFLFIAAAAAAVVCLVIGYVISLFRHSLASWRATGWIIAGVACFLLIISAALKWIDGYGVLRRRVREYVTAEREARREYETILTELALGEIRGQINQSRISYDCRLRIREAPGLAEVYSDEYWVENKATRRLAEFIEQMASGGTIGLAGSRGAGKTSLIRSRCPEEIHAGLNINDVALFVSAPVEYAPREFVLHLLATLCRAYLRFRGSAGQAEPPAPVPVISPPTRLRSAGPRTAAIGEGNTQRTDLKSQARHYLKEVRYLQSYTTTLGASASLPAGIAGLSGQTAAAAAEIPRPYPELVTEFCRFLRMVATEVRESGGRVFIGIDELDKISDGQQAQRFINELKVVLGVPNCYYLVAVSENALAAYEMRGLPMRDAFDSAFDEVIRLDHLCLEESRELLFKRVVRMSEPFICLCHCLSGGLPRDLIRVARHMVAESRRPNPGSDQLAVVCQRLVTIELARKLHAIGIRWTGRPPRESESNLLYAIQHVVNRETDTNDLHAGLHAILHGPAKTGYSEFSEQGIFATSELSCYLYYLVTLLEVFTQDLTREEIEDGTTGHPTQDGTFDQLCLARQTLASDPRRAWLTITAFRIEWELQTIPYPGPTSRDSLVVGR